MRAALARAQKIFGLEGDDSICTSYFFDANNGTSLQMSRQGFYRSILGQLLRKESSSRELIELVSRWETSETELNDISSLQQKFSQVLQLISKDGPRVRLYVDALDECYEEPQDDLDSGSNTLASARALLEYLVNQCQEGLMSVCISTREHVAFRASLRSATMIKVESHNNADIKRYLDQKLILPGVDQQVRTKLIRSLLHHASSMFQWVKLVVQHLNTWTGKMTEEAIEEEISKFSGGLTKLYRRILDRLDRKTHGAALVLLQLIQAAMRPLTVAEVKSALSYTLDAAGQAIPLDTTRFKDQVREWCEGLIEVRAATAPSQVHSDTNADPSQPLRRLEVHFTHHSVRNFLEGTDDEAMGQELVLHSAATSKPSSSSSSSRSHLAVAMVCLSLIKAGARSQAEDFRPYAAQFWTTHLRKGDGAIDESFHPPTMVLSCGRHCKPIITTWIRLVMADLSDSYRDRRDFGIATDVRDDASLFELLAFEGCTKMLIRHSRECIKQKQCHGSIEVVESAICLAAGRGWHETVRALLVLAKAGNGDLRAQSVNLDRLVSRHHDYTPLYAACVGGNVAVAKILLAEGCDFLGQGQTAEGARLQPLHAVVSNGCIDIVQILLSHARAKGQLDALLTNKDERDRTVFHLAAAGGRCPIFMMLLDHIDGPEHILDSASSDILLWKMQGGLTARDAAVVFRDDVIRRNPSNKARLHEYHSLIKELDSFSRDDQESTPPPQQILASTAQPLRGIEGRQRSSSNYISAVVRPMLPAPRYESWQIGPARASQPELATATVIVRSRKRSRNILESS